MPISHYNSENVSIQDDNEKKKFSLLSIDIKFYTVLCRIMYVNYQTFFQLIES